MARIYTRTGDGGETSLLGGRRASKADPRVDLYGGVDELNSCLGLAVALAVAERPGDARLAALGTELAALQSRLLDLGALLADPERCARRAFEDEAALAASTRGLEDLIDRLEAELPPLRNFILPGGGPAASAFHLARTVCRRIERRAVAAAREVAQPAGVVVFLNRLSDLLFVAARWVGRATGAAEVPWRPSPTPRDE